MTRIETAVLRLLQLPKVGPRTLSRVVQTAAARGESLDELFGPPDRDWSEYGLPAYGRDVVRSTADAAEQLGEQLDAHEVRMLVKGGPGFPPALADRLGTGCPPVLFARGPAAVTDRPGVAFCGSRRASEVGLRIAGAVATAFARDGVNVVSGLANGVDLTAHVAALAAGGVTTAVLAEGILRFRMKAELAAAFDPARLLVVSQFPPRMSWSAGNAMQRNEVILGLADAVLVVESGTDGGTLAAGQSALAAGRPLFVVDYPEPPPSAGGNRLLLDRGAVAVPVRDGRVDLAGIRRAVAQDGGERPPDRPTGPRQPTLFE